MMNMQYFVEASHVQPYVYDYNPKQFYPFEIYYHEPVYYHPQSTFNPYYKDLGKPINEDIYTPLPMVHNDTNQHQCDNGQNTIINNTHENHGSSEEIDDQKSSTENQIKISDTQINLEITQKYAKKFFRQKKVLQKDRYYEFILSGHNILEKIETFRGGSLRSYTWKNHENDVLTMGGHCDNTRPFIVFKIVTLKNNEIIPISMKTKSIARNKDGSLTIRVKWLFSKKKEKSNRKPKTGLRFIVEVRDGANDDRLIMKFSNESYFRKSRFLSAQSNLNKISDSKAQKEMDTHGVVFPCIKC